MAGSGKVPEIGVDEALRLFLAIAYPGGIPAEVEAELVAAVKQQVAVDRPEWAQASAGPAPVAPAAGPAAIPPGQPPPTPETPAPYSQVKAQAVHKAQAEEVPSDPEERYFYERRKELAARIEQRKVEEREAAERERLARVAREGAARSLGVAPPSRPQPDLRPALATGRPVPGQPALATPVRRRREHRSPGMRPPAVPVIARATAPAVTAAARPRVDERNASIMLSTQMRPSASERPRPLSTDALAASGAAQRSRARVRIAMDDALARPERGLELQQQARQDTAPARPERGLGLTPRTAGSGGIAVDGSRSGGKRRGGLEVK